MHRPNEVFDGNRESFNGKCPKGETVKCSTGYRVVLTVRVKVLWV